MLLQSTSHCGSEDTGPMAARTASSDAKREEQLVRGGGVVDAVSHHIYHEQYRDTACSEGKPRQSYKSEAMWAQ